MLRIIAWLKSKEYKWGRDDFCKASRRFLYWALAIFVVVMVITAIPTLDSKTYLIVLILSLVLLAGMCGSAFTIQWADKKLKQSNKRGV